MSEILSGSAALVATVRTRKRRRLGSPLIELSFVVLGAVVIMALFGPLIAPQEPGRQDLVLGLAKPSLAHWFGTDTLGRDVFSRVIVGARTALLGPLVIALGSMVLGNVLGLLAGYRRGWVDAAIMRSADLVWSIPSLLVIIVVSGAIGGGYWLAVGLLLVLTVPFDARVVRGATLEQSTRPYVEAARILGISEKRIMLLHVWPNISPVAAANTFLVLAGSIVGLASLSFLGLGVPPGTADWGLMVAEGRSLLFSNPVSVLAPAGMIVLTATSLNLIGDWLYEQLAGRGTAG